MKVQLLWLWFWLFSFAPGAISQKIDPLAKATLKDTATVNKILQVSREKFGVDPSQAMNLAVQARDLSQRIGYRKGEATALKNMGTAYYLLSNPTEALTTWQEALRIFEEMKDAIGVADLLGNIGIFYYNRGDNVKALDYYLRSLKIAESIGYKKGMMSALNNTGGVYYYKTTTSEKALKYYLMALPLCEDLGDKNSLGVISVNVGNIYLKQGDLTRAYQYFNNALKAYEDNTANLPMAYNALGLLHFKKGETKLSLDNYNKALQIGRSTNNKYNVVRSLTGLAKLYMQQQDYRTAIRYYREAEMQATEIQATLEFEDIYEDLAKAYSSQGDFKNAFHYQSLFGKVKDTLYNIASDNKIAALQFDFELEKKQSQINLLTKDKALKDAELRQQRLAKNAFMAGLVLIFIIAFIIYRNYRAKVKINRILDHQKEQIEQLLLNILPVEVAKELQEHGQATPRNYESVSVLFTDFKGFTSIADKMTPAALVEELNTCFMAFDDIIVRHNLEKIKTIGDSYMCAGGIPTPDDQHVCNMVKASLEIQEYIRKNNERRLELGLVPWEARVGVHVGPVVAGVVGKKKYAYDIWGSTVNIASRMESNGAPGRVNISSAVYEKVKDQYACTYRGKIYAKNVGEVDMYFIERELQPGEPIPVVQIPKESEIKAEELFQ